MLNVKIHFISYQLCNNLLLNIIKLFYSELSLMLLIISPLNLNRCERNTLLLEPKLSTNKTCNDRYSYFTELPLYTKTKGSTLCHFFNDTYIDGLQNRLSLSCTCWKCFLALYKRLEKKSLTFQFTTMLFPHKIYNDGYN